MPNLLNQPVDYKMTRTAFGIWKRYLSESGMFYREFVSHTRIGALPLVHIAFGRNPETGSSATAKGILAIGRRAIGVVAIGQLAAGFIAIGQAAFGFFAFGQLAIGLLAGIGQGATGAFALGQFAFGIVSIGQFAAGAWAFGQIHHGADLWSLIRKS